MDHSTIEAFAETFANAPRVAEMEVRSLTHGTLRFRRSLASAEKKPRPATKKAVAASAPATETTASPVVSPAADTIVTSTLVGIFRAAVRTPVGIGSRVIAGQTIGMIEVMRLSDEIPSPVSGEIAAIYVLDGQPVEYGQPLFEIIAVANGEDQDNDA